MFLLRYEDWRPSVAGSPVRLVREPVVHDDGSITVEVTGKEDLQAYIQSFAESTDINVIMSRFANGDLSVLNQAKGFFGDVTEMPKTYAELLQMQLDAQNLFDRLPIEVKQEFGNDVNQFLSSSMEEDFLKRLGVDQKSDVKESEVIES